MGSNPDLNDLKIRKARATDLTEILNIYNFYVEQGLATCDQSKSTIESRRNWFRKFDSQHPLFVATLNQSVIAYCPLGPISPKEGYSMSREIGLYVDQNYQSKGIGSKLLDHSLNAAKGLSIHHIQAKIFTVNEGSIRHFKRFGFQTVGTFHQIAHFQNQFYDVVILECLLNS